jgi:hypothetical protein
LNARTIRVVLGVPLLLFAPWLATVLVVTWAGYPGVVCVTPLAWLLALRVGLACAAQSTRPRPAQRLQEAALAGGVFGLLQGVLFWIIVPRLGEIKASEQVSATLLSVSMIVVGVLAGAVLAAFTARAVERRRAASEAINPESQP